MKGIRSYAQLNEIIVDILKEYDREMAAREICDIVITRFDPSKVRVNPVKVAKRLRGRENVTVRHSKDGLCYYRYVEK